MPPCRPRQRLKKPQIDVLTVEKRGKVQLVRRASNFTCLKNLSECVEFNYPFSLSVFYSWGWCVFFCVEIEERLWNGFKYTQHRTTPHIFASSQTHLTWQCNSNFYNFYLNRGKSRSRLIWQEKCVFSYVFNFITFMKLICNVNWSW